jgi:hypothetical protein
MAQGTTQILLPQTVWPGPNGATIAIVGLKKQAAAYYLANSDLQTISWGVNRSFTGVIKIQASITTDPTESDWWDVYTLPLAAANYNDGQYGYHNLVGNFVWLRASVSSWTDGIIELVTASY